jgi:hypothetical protein
MKLRLRGNSLRLRLTKSEVDQLARTGTVTEQVRFSPSQLFSYTLRALSEQIPLRASFDQQTVIVELSKPAVEAWAAADTVGIHGRHPTGDSEALAISIEKDFACLERRSSGEDHDSYPNPLATEKHH